MDEGYCIYAVWLAGGTIARTLIADNRLTGQNTALKNAAAVSMDPGTRLENCLLCGNQTDGYCGAVYCNGGTIVNCTVARNSATLGTGGILFTGTCALTNTIAYGNVSAADAQINNVDYLNQINNNQLTINLTAVNSLTDNLDSPKERVTVVQDGCFYADPKFRNPEGGNYQIKGTGPCRDAGADIDWPAGAKDLRGNGRVKFAHVDIGCYECQTAGMLLLVR